MSNNLFHSGDEAIERALFIVRDLFFSRRANPAVQRRGIRGRIAQPETGAMAGNRHRQSTAWHQYPCYPDNA